MVLESFTYDNGWVISRWNFVIQVPPWSKIFKGLNVFKNHSKNVVVKIGEQNTDGVEVPYSEDIPESDMLSFQCEINDDLTLVLGIKNKDKKVTLCFNCNANPNYEMIARRFGSLMDAFELTIFSAIIK